MTNLHFKIISVNTSTKKGIKKTPVDEVRLLPQHGIEGDAHSGPWHRQVSLLALEDIETMREKGLDLSSGDFGENITTQGVDWPSLPLGAIIQIDDVKMELSQIGKVCHNRCAIYDSAGDCIMPRQGVFAKVIEGGVIDHQSIGSVHFG